MEFKTIVGLEIHVEMKTNSKMFSSAPVSFGSEPNTKVDIVDMAFPGTMPTLNKKAVVNAIRVAHALKMDIDDIVMFERKNYFYSDLPKGYQITQQFRPLGKNGSLIIKTSKGEKNIRIERLHMEEDTCKQLHYSDCTLLDYNRAGIPLIEIVTYPDIETGEEAMKFVENIRSIVTFLDVSDGKMEEGSLRCDVNISLRSVGDEKLGTKVEIKNLNSITNIQKAIEFEIKRQSLILASGGQIIQETRRFDKNKKETVLMRVKDDEIDYKCFTDPNLPPVKLSEEFIKNAIETSPELAFSRINRYLSMGLNEYNSSLLTSSKDISDYFDEACKVGVNPKLIANWINGEIQSYLNKENISIKDFKIKPKSLSELIKLIEGNKISNNQARVVFDKMIEEEKTPEAIVKELGFVQLNDEDELLPIIIEVLDQNPGLVMDYKNGKDRVLGFLVGQIMKKTWGKANPQLTNILLIREIKRR